MCFKFIQKMKLGKDGDGVWIYYINISELSNYA